MRVQCALHSLRGGWRRPLHSLRGRWRRPLHISKGAKGVFSKYFVRSPRRDSSYLGECFSRKESDGEDNGCRLHICEGDNKTKENVGCDGS